LKRGGNLLSNAGDKTLDYQFFTAYEPLLLLKLALNVQPDRRQGIMKDIIETLQARRQEFILSAGNPLILPEETAVEGLYCSPWLALTMV